MKYYAYTLMVDGKRRGLLIAEGAMRLPWSEFREYGAYADTTPVEQWPTWHDAEIKRNAK